MKKYMYVLAFSFLSIPAAYAQFELGLKGGLNWNKPDANGFGDSSVSNLNIKSGSGNFFGLTAAYAFNQKFKLQGEFMYSFMNANANASVSIVNLKIDMKTEYYQFPLLLTYTPVEFKGIKPYVALGPNFGYITKGKAVATGSVLGIFPVSQTVDLSDSNWQDTKRLDIGITGAVGATYRLGPGNLSLDFRYLHGLTDIDETDTKFKNRTWMLSLGYAYVFGKKD